jgi:hypothetical protein
MWLRIATDPVLAPAITVTRDYGDSLRDFARAITVTVYAISLASSQRYAIA